MDKNRKQERREFLKVIGKTGGALAAFLVAGTSFPRKSYAGFFHTAYKSVVRTKANPYNAHWDDNCNCDCYCEALCGCSCRCGCSGSGLNDPDTNFDTNWEGVWEGELAPGIETGLGGDDHDDWYNDVFKGLYWDYYRNR